MCGYFDVSDSVTDDWVHSAINATTIYTDRLG